MGVAVLAMAGLASCVGDLDQLPKDSTLVLPDDISNNMKENIGQMMGKCYSAIAVSGQSGAGSSDIEGLDHGAGCWSRAIFMLNEFTTDEAHWIWPDAGVFDLVTDTWSSSNTNIYGTYCRLLTHIAICNDFLRNTSDDNPYDWKFDGELRGIVDQFRLEARALRGLSYFYLIDMFGNAVDCWDTEEYGKVPQQSTRAALYAKVVADLEDVLAKFPAGQPVYGRIGKDAVEALLVKYYLNAEVFTGVAAWQQCWNHAKNIIDRHGTKANNFGLAKDYLSLFCGNNDIFAPGGTLTDQNEILWNIPYSYKETESYGGTTFLILAALSDKSAVTPGMLGMNGQWTCMNARAEFSELFDFSSGVSADGRTYLWQTEAVDRQFNINNDEFKSFFSGYIPNKFSNVLCDASTGVMPRWIDKANNNIPRIGVYDGYAEGEEPRVKFVQDVDKDGNPKVDASGNPVGTYQPVKANYGIDASATFANADYPVIRLAEVLLSAAEAYVRGGAGSQTEALDYVNAVRSRAGVDNWTNAQLSQLDNLLNERARELYWENCRRTDLVRFNKFAGSNYNWSWKANAPKGSAIPAHMNVFPIPSRVINSYPGGSYKQNPGY